MVVKTIGDYITEEEENKREQQISYLCSELEIPVDKDGHYETETILAFILLSIVNADRIYSHKDPWPNALFDL